MQFSLFPFLFWAWNQQDGLRSNTILADLKTAVALPLWFLRELFSLERLDCPYYTYQTLNEISR